MTNQDLEKVCIKMQMLEDKYPATFTTNKEWLRLYKYRELLSNKFVKSELDRQRTKLQRLNGRDTESTETLIRQYETYLKNHELKGGK